MHTSVTVTLEKNLAVVTVDNPPVNALSQQVRAGLMAAIEQTEADDSIEGVVLNCAGKTFIAGADVREFSLPLQPPHLPDVIFALEATTKPWIALLKGSALGGGLEVALGCHFRVAVADAKMGTPEVNLGLIPGAGGTVRLPRLIQPEQALDLIAGGKPITSAKALDIGLIDQRFDEGIDSEAAARKFCQDVIGQTLPESLLKRRPHQPADLEKFEQQKTGIRAKTAGQLAPSAAIEAVEAALSLPVEQALTQERERFLALKEHPQSSALRHVFFAERSSARLPETKAVTPRSITSIGIIGGGTMGSGIAAACLLAGYAVVLIEQTPEALENGLSRINAILDNSLKRGLITSGLRATLSTQLQGDQNYAALSEVSLVIEAAFEDMAVKQSIFAALDKVVSDSAILATNTSYLDVNHIANSTRDPSRVIGLHFFSPAHIMKLLELVIPDAATPEVLASALALGKKLGKITVPSGVCDGFIGNRVMSAYRRECDYMIEDGAYPEQVDQAMRDFGFPMGIFAMQDLAGLDIGWAMRKRQSATRPPDQRYVAIADQLCEQGRFGRKTGAGWYSYAENKQGQTDPAVHALIEAESARQGIQRKPFSADEIMERILSVMQAEGQALLAEKIARSAADIDVVMVNGYGFPRWKGGPMYMMDVVGQT